MIRLIILTVILVSLSGCLGTITSDNNGTSSPKIKRIEIDLGKVDGK